LNKKGDIEVINRSNRYCSTAPREKEEEDYTGQERRMKEKIAVHKM
jgi:hypothetical protein